MLSVFVTWAVTICAAYVIYRFAKGAWNSSDVDEKLEDIQSLEDNFDKVKDVDVDELQMKQDKVNKVINQ